MISLALRRILRRYGRATACPNTPPGGRGFGPGNDCWKNLADKRATKKAQQIEGSHPAQAQAIRKRVERGLVTGPERRAEAGRKARERAGRAKPPSPVEQFRAAEAGRSRETASVPANRPPRPERAKKTLGRIAERRAQAEGMLRHPEREIAELERSLETTRSAELEKQKRARIAQLKEYVAAKRGSLAHRQLGTREARIRGAQ